MSAEKVNGHSVEPPVAPGEVTITRRCFKCERPLGTLEEWTFGGVVLCAPCFTETVKASEEAEKPARRRKAAIPKWTAHLPDGTRITRPFEATDEDAARKHAAFVCGRPVEVKPA